MNSEPITCWTTTLIDAGDGSGDAILQFPDELLASLGWKEGDELSIEWEDSKILLRKIN
jgi:hypothetical protein